MLITRGHAFLVWMGLDVEAREITSADSEETDVSDKQSDEIAVEKVGKKKKTTFKEKRVCV